MERAGPLKSLAACVLMALGCARAGTTDEGLQARAQREGAVRVIVTLAVAGAQPPSAEAIGDAQERLLAALRGTRYDNLRRFRNLPQLALTAGPDALQVLLSSPLVANVAPDTLAKPSQ